MGVIPTSQLNIQKCMKRLHCGLLIWCSLSLRATHTSTSRTSIWQLSLSANQGLHHLPTTSHAASPELRACPARWQDLVSTVTVTRTSTLSMCSTVVLFYIFQTCGCSSCRHKWIRRHIITENKCLNSTKTKVQEHYKQEFKWLWRLPQ